MNTLIVILSLAIAVAGIFIQSKKIYALIIYTFLSLIGIMTFDVYVKGKDAKTDIEHAMIDVVDKWNTAHMLDSRVENIPIEKIDLMDVEAPFEIILPTEGERIPTEPVH